MARKRFVILHKEGHLAGQKIIMDTQTGVNYLYAWDGYAGGLTPLLQRDGSVVVTSASGAEQDPRWRRP